MKWGEIDKLSRIKQKQQTKTAKYVIVPIASLIKKICIFFNDADKVMLVAKPKYNSKHVVLE